MCKGGERAPPSFATSTSIGEIAAKVPETTHRALQALEAHTKSLFGRLFAGFQSERLAIFVKGATSSSTSFSVGLSARSVIDCLAASTTLPLPSRLLDPWDPSAPSSPAACSP